MSRASGLAGFSTSISPPSNLNVGVVTATSFSGNLTGTATTATFAGTATTATFAGTAYGLTGSPNITVGIITGTTLNGTSGLVSVGTTIKTKGFIETQTTQTLSGTVLPLNAANGTVFTHTTTGNIGIVSFSGISTASAGTQTFTVLVTQGATPFSTTTATGIGTILSTVVISPGNVGYSTHVKVGGGTTIVLTNSAGALDLLTFVVSYDGATSIANTSFKIVGFAATDFRGIVN